VGSEGEEVEVAAEQEEEEQAQERVRDPGRRAFFREGKDSAGNIDKRGMEGMGEPTHSLGNKQTAGREEVMRQAIAATVKMAKEKQEEEMKKITLGACMGREKYRQAWEEIGGLEIIRNGVALRWNWMGPPVDGG
jgi:hypothetical protein